MSWKADDMGMDFYTRIKTKKYTVLDAVIILAIYMAILIGYTIFMI